MEFKVGDTVRSGETLFEVVALPTAGDPRLTVRYKSYPDHVRHVDPKVYVLVVSEAKPTRQKRGGHDRQQRGGFDRGKT